MVLGIGIASLRGFAQTNDKPKPTPELGIESLFHDEKTDIMNEKIFINGMPLERQFKQGNHGDCQTVAALKYLALTQPEKLKGMISGNENSFTVYFPKTDFKNAAASHGNFDYKGNVIDVSIDDIIAFREWYGDSGSLGQDIIESALIKRMQNNNSNFSSVKEYADHLGGLISVFLANSESALFILTGKVYQSYDKRSARNLFLKGDSDLSRYERQRKARYANKIRTFFRQARIGSASQSPGYFEGDKYRYYSDFEISESKALDRNRDGVAEGHAYAVVYDEKSDTVTVYNTWNQYEPKSKNDTINNGIFTLSIEEFLERFTEFSVKK